MIEFLEFDKRRILKFSPRTYFVRMKDYSYLELCMRKGICRFVETKFECGRFYREEGGVIYAEKELPVFYV